MQECSTLLLSSPILRTHEGKQIALGRVGEHLDQVCQMLAFTGELDQGLLAEVADVPAMGSPASLIEERAPPLASGA